MPKQDFETYLPPLEKGTKLKNGQYEIISDTVNAGGFGRIYRAYGSRKEKNGDRHIVAIKEFCVNELQDLLNRSASLGTYSMAEVKDHVKLLREKFYEEADLLAKLNNQRDRHVPRVHGKVFQDGRRLFYAMTFIDGPTLTQVVKGKGVLSEEIAVDIIVQIGKVLYKAHNWGVMHCDVSPNNIMLQDGFAILVDFGNAKSNPSLIHKIERPSIDLCCDFKSYADLQIGTPGFSPLPKLIGTPQGDVYSLASTLFFLLTGKKCAALVSKRSLDNSIKLLEGFNVSKETVTAIMNALNVMSANCTTDMKKFLSELPSKIVFNSLLNYNDYDYDKR